MRIACLAAGAVALGWLGFAAGAHAGANARATARMYWQVEGGPGLAARNVDSAVVQVVVTVKGVQDLRGADVQLGVMGPEGRVPRTWQAQPGGCAEAGFAIQRGGFGGYPDLFSTGLKIPRLLQPASQMWFHYAKQPCLTPDSAAVIWQMAAGGEGVPRDSTVEYAVLAFRMNLRASACWAADSAGAGGVCVYAFNHFPCKEKIPRGTLTLVDGTVAKDYIPFEPGYDKLTWRGGACPVPWEGPADSLAARPATGGGQPHK